MPVLQVQPGKRKIVVQLQCGTRIEFTYKVERTCVHHLLSSLARKLGRSGLGDMLMYDGLRMDSDEKLSSYNLEEGDIIEHMLFQMGD